MRAQAMRHQEPGGRDPGHIEWRADHLAIFRQDPLALWLATRMVSAPVGCRAVLPAVLPRCRVTERLRDHAGRLVAEGGRTVALAARECGLSWPVTHQAFAASADPLLEQPAAPVAHLGIDEHRRDRSRWRADAVTGEYVLLADRWHTCFFDLSGDQGLLGQVEGRTADDAAYWLAGAPPAWRDAVQVVAIDMCSIYASAVRRALPHAQLVVDLFHVVQLAVKMTGDVRRRAVGRSTGGAAAPAMPSTGSRACWCATWSACGRSSSPPSWTP